VLEAIGMPGIVGTLRESADGPVAAAAYSFPATPGDSKCEIGGELSVPSGCAGSQSVSMEAPFFDRIVVTMEPGFGFRPSHSRAAEQLGDDGVAAVSRLAPRPGQEIDDQAHDISVSSPWAGTTRGPAQDRRRGPRTEGGPRADRRRKAADVGCG
jgi:hypothetical protein